MKRPSPRLLLSTFAGLAIALALIAAPAASAAPVRVYDPAHSLSGACLAPSEEDPIQDPGCPGGTHPPRSLSNPCGTVADSYGDIYVASSAPGTENGGNANQGRIDIFNAQGEFLTEIEEHFKPCDLAVDSQGNLYVLERQAHEPEPGQLATRVLLFTPSLYPPSLGVEYPTESGATIVYSSSREAPEAIAVDPSNDHLYINERGAGIVEFGSAAEAPGGEWTPLREGIGQGIEELQLGTGFDVYGKNHFIYSAAYDATDKNHGDLPQAQRVLVIDPETNHKVCEAKGTPSGGFSFPFGEASLAVDQTDGSVYVSDTHVNKVIDHFGADCGFLDRLPTSPPLQSGRGPELHQPDGGPGLDVDAPCLGAGGVSCDRGGYHSPSANRDSVYVGSGTAENTSHLFAFPLREPGPPTIEGQAVASLSATDARLVATLNPHAVSTTYHFEYISQADFQAAGEDYGPGAISAPVPAGSAGDGSTALPVSVTVSGLSPGTAYRFRLVAENCSQPLSLPACQTLGEGNPGGEGADVAFATYPPEAQELPDGRGYELVTPPDTGGYVPTSNEMGFQFVNSSTAFPTDLAGPQGNSLIFGIEGGSIPGLPGGGYHDIYEARRETLEGRYGRWQSQFNGLTDQEAKEPTPGAFSADHDISFWSVFKSTTPPEGTYIHRPAGPLLSQCTPEPGLQLEFIGCGTLGTDHYATGEYISPGGGHIIFGTENNVYESAQRLEPLSPPKGTAAVYDRTADGITHVVSLRPDGSAFGANENAAYRGSSADGTAVAFAVGANLYVRLDDAETSTVAEGGAAFGGLSTHAQRLFYLQPSASEPTLEGTSIPQGQIFVCEVRSGPCAGAQKTQEATQIASGGQSVLINVSADGSHAYFTSPLQLDGTKGTAGQENLYVWDAQSASVRYVATLTRGDVIGRPSHVSFRVGGLGLWVPYAVGRFPGPWNGPASDPSRTTPDGTVLVFESRAGLTGYDSEGRSEIYRYETTSDSLTCLSCPRSGIRATSDAQLQSDSPPQLVSLPPVNELSSIANLTSSGARVFFQSAERLVLGDTDGKTDVYEWEAGGEAGCEVEAGCLRLISSGHSASDDYLYAMSADGRDVFFETSDTLTARDRDATPSIYDAREGGGEAPEVLPPTECVGEACQPAIPAPQERAPISSGFEGSGNPTHRRRHRRRHHRSKHHHHKHPRSHGSRKGAR